MLLIGYYAFRGQSNLLDEPEKPSTRPEKLIVIADERTNGRV